MTMKRTPKTLSIHTTTIRALRVLADDDARRVAGATNKVTLCLGKGCGAITLLCR